MFVGNKKNMSTDRNRCNKFTHNICDVWNHPLPPRFSIGFIPRNAVCVYIDVCIDGQEIRQTADVCLLVTFVRQRWVTWNTWRGEVNNPLHKAECRCFRAVVPIACGHYKLAVLCVCKIRWSGANIGGCLHEPPVTSLSSRRLGGENLDSNRHKDMRTSSELLASQHITLTYIKPRCYEGTDNKLRIELCLIVASNIFDFYWPEML